jgi:hypothetical protein
VAGLAAAARRRAPGKLSGRIRALLTFTGDIMAAPTPHPDLSLVAGDDWAVAGTLLDTAGQPLDLTDATLEWTLISPDGAVAASFPGSAEIAIWEPFASGAITIILRSDITEGLDPGRYSDRLRVTIDGSCRSAVDGMHHGRRESVQCQTTGLARAAAVAAAARPGGPTRSLSGSPPAR